MNTAMELRAKALRIQHEARAKLTDATEATFTEVEVEFDAMIAEADALEARAKRFDDLDARDTAINAADARRPVEDRQITSTATSVEDRQANAFDAYLRGSLSGEQRAILRELRSQTVGTPADGGYLVPQTWASTLIVGMKAYGPMNDGSVVSYLNTASGGQINLPSMDDTASTGARIAENTTVDADTLAFGSKTLNAYKYTSKVFKISSELFQDSGVDIQAVITAAMAERLGRVINTDLTTGAGTTGIPNGVATAASAGVTLALANSAITADDLISLQHSVDPAYRSNAGFMLNDATVAKIRKLKDDNGAYIWQPGLAAGVAGTILGQPFYVNQDIASSGVAGKSVLYGDFSKYTVRRVNGFTLRRLDELYAESDNVGFVAFARIDGELMDTRAIKALVNPA